MKRCLVILFLLQTAALGRHLDLQFEWSKINFTWDPQVTLEEGPDVYDGYIYENNMPMAANKWRDKMFVSIPRRRAGVPSTLNFVWLNGSRTNPPLIPYPDWKTNRMNRQNDTQIHLVSAYRTVVDECDRLWVMDDGRIESFGPTGGIVRIQPPSIVVFDLTTDTIIRRYFFPDYVLKPATSTVNLAVDVERSSCHDAFAYVPDMLGFGLIVYSFDRNESWRVTHKYFYIEPLSSYLSVAGLKFQWYDGVFGVGLGRKNPAGFRTAYFQAMAGTHLFSVSTRILKNKELATRTFHGNDFKVLFNKGPDTQSTSTDLHKATGILFFGLINQNGLGCWNTHKRKRADYVDVVFADDEEFIYPSDVKVTGNDVIVITNKFPIYTYETLNYTEINFRIFVTDVYEAVKHTVCH